MSAGDHFDEDDIPPRPDVPSGRHPRALLVFVLGLLALAMATPTCFVAQIDDRTGIIEIPDWAEALRFPAAFLGIVALVLVRSIKKESLPLFVGRGWVNAAQTLAILGAFAFAAPYCVAASEGL